MSEKRLLALIGFLLGLLGGVLVLADAIPRGPVGQINVTTVFNLVVTALLGLLLLLGSVLLYRGRYSTGGIVNIVIGAVVILLDRSTIAGILGIVSGVFGLLAHESRA